MTHILMRNAHVDVQRIIDSKKHTCAEITINNKLQHRFSPKSRISKHLDIMTEKDLADRLSGGTYFAIDNEIVDYRDGQYNGFVHTDEGVDVFMNILGHQRKKDLPFRHTRKSNADDISPIVLRKVWSNSDIVVPGYPTGGEFTTQLSFVWNPFVKTINSTFDLVRLICTNGMVGLTSFLNTKIPLFNRWEEHLDIASRQIQNKVSSTVISRIQQMALDRASVSDCLLLEQHAFDRLYSPVERSNTERTRLATIMSAVSPSANLDTVYQDAVFHDKNLAAQLPAHISTFDAFNIATEMRTHTEQSSKSSDNALDRFANTALFDRDDNYHAAAAMFSKPADGAFENSEKAFWGVMN